MAFATGYLKDPTLVGSGEIHGSGHVILGSTNFENDLIIGRFAKIETGDAIHNLDASSTPVIAGVVMRMASYPVEAGSAVDENLFTNISYVAQGLVTVDGTNGQTPARGTPLYAVNASGSGVNFGKATTTSTNNTLTNATMVEDLGNDVWLVQLA